MSYQVLARKWRPRNFAEMVGQEHVLKALVNALDHDRLHHAFLFTGTRGVGKTTIARILAKSLNCEKGVSSDPCGECSACVEIDAGRFVDLIEVDAASRTGVDDTRELTDNVQYAPTRGRYKIYLIDEVHMLSKSAFNALLKTLEEPPPHVKFLLATTDPQKIPITVLSRCLQFNLKRLPVSLIQAHLQHILEAEKISQQPAAVSLIANAADGSMRDALSLLDQAIAFGGGALHEDDVRSMLGSIEKKHVRTLIEALATGAGNHVLDTVARLDEQAPDYEMVLDELASMLQRMAVMQVVPDAGDGSDDADMVRELAAKLSAEDTQLYYQIALLGKRDLPLAPSPRGGFEMVLLRMLTFAPQRAAIESAPRNQSPGIRSSANAALSAAVVKKDVKVSAAPVSEPTTQKTAWREPDWVGLVGSLDLRGATQQLALNCVYQRREGSILYLALDATHEHMATEQLLKRLEDALTRYFGEPLKVRIQPATGELVTPAKLDAQRQEERVRTAQQTIAEDPNVRALCDTFGTQINPDLVKPLD
ncbi:MAG TPA: DNA polymerase III subunit gamma/tau [Gammaproteobacteria bacterium]|nr:DNA polymerase III subunit gamma/tau [Gammaproteobacteria bacterium]